MSGRGVPLARRGQTTSARRGKTWVQVARRPTTVGVPALTLEDYVESYLEAQARERIDCVKDSLKYFDCEELLKAIIHHLASREAQSELDEVMQEARSAKPGQAGSLAHSKFHNVANTCLEQLELLPQLELILTQAKLIYKAFLPQKLIWNQGWFKTIELDLDRNGNDPTGKGSYVYHGDSTNSQLSTPGCHPTECLPFPCCCSPDQPTLSSQPSLPLSRSSASEPLLGDVEQGEPQGPSARIEWCPKAGTDKSGKDRTPRMGHWSFLENGKDKFQLSAELVTDAGCWRSSKSQPETDRLVHVDASGNNILSRNSLRELRECFAKDRPVEAIVAQVQKACAGPFAEQTELMEHVTQMVQAMCGVADKLGIAGVDGPSSGNVDALFSTLVDLANLQLGDTLCKVLEDHLTQKFGHDGLTERILEQCKIWNERLLTVSDLHDVHVSYLPRLFHRLCHWSSLPAAAAQRSDAPKEAGCLRFVAISDTHGWESDLELPQGDVLLHCGNLLLRSGPMSRFDDPPKHLKDLLAVFDEPPFSGFKWIVIAPGEHDRTLCELAEQHPKKLLGILPKRVIFLRKSNSVSFGGDPRLVAMVEGKVRLKLQLDSSQLDSIELAKGTEEASCTVSCADAPDASSADVILASSLDKVGEELRQTNAKVVFGGRTSEGGREGWVYAAVTSELLLPCRPAQIFEVMGKQHLRTASGLPSLPSGFSRQDLSSLGQRLWKWIRGLQSGTTGEGEADVEGGRKGGSGEGVRVDESAAAVELRSDLVANWIPRDCVAEETLDAHRRKWNGAICKEVQVLQKKQQLHQGAADDEREVWPRLIEVYTWNDHTNEFLHDRLVKERLKLEVPETVWNEYISVRTEQGDWKQITSLPTQQSSFPVSVHFPKKSRTNLSEYDVCGPAVLWSFQAFVHWVAAGFLPYLAYNTAPEPAPGQAFAVYDTRLWSIFLLLFWHLWWVQTRCLKIIVMAQVHVMGSGFKVLGRSTTYWWWRYIVWWVSLVSLMDITAQCLFFGQFRRSVESNSDIAAVWRITVAKSYVCILPFFPNIVHLFTVGWALMFGQLIYMLAHLFVTQNKGVQYDMGSGDRTGSMPQGYHTVASSFNWKLETGKEGENEDLGLLRCASHRCCWSWKLHCMHLCKDLRRCKRLLQTTQRYVQTRLGQAFDKQNHMPFWHADILRVMATYGRMAAVTWSEQSLVEKRLEQEMSQEKVNVARFYQIMFNRLKDFVMRVLLIEVLEKGLKLEIQCSVFAIDLALQRDQSQTRPLNVQMRLAIALSFLSAIYAVWSHTRNFFMLYRLHTRCMDRCKQSGNWLNRGSTTTNQLRVKILFFFYAFFDIILLFIIVHNVVKYVKAKNCEFSMWNLGTGCVSFGWRGNVTHRTLILND